MVNKKRMFVTIMVVGLFATMILSGTTVAAHAQEFINRIILSDDENDILTSMNHATLIDDENEKFIGKEVHDNSQLESSKDFLGKQGAGNTGSDGVVKNAVVELFADGVIKPINITNFQTKDNMTPEVIIPNGSAATFGQTNSTGWNTFFQNIFYLKMISYNKKPWLSSSGNDSRGFFVSGQFSFPVPSSCRCSELSRPSAWQPDIPAYLS